MLLHCNSCRRSSCIATNCSIMVPLTKASPQGAPIVVFCAAWFIRTSCLSITTFSFPVNVAPQALSPIITNYYPVWLAAAATDAPIIVFVLPVINFPIQNRQMCYYYSINLTKMNRDMYFNHMLIMDAWCQVQYYYYHHHYVAPDNAW